MFSLDQFIIISYVCMSFTSTRDKMSTILGKIDVFTFAITGPSLEHLKNNTCDVHVGGGNAEVEPLGVIGAIGFPGSGRSLHLHRAVVLVECHSHVAVLSLIRKLHNMLWLRDETKPTYYCLLGDLLYFFIIL